MAAKKRAVKKKARPGSGRASSPRRGTDAYYQQLQLDIEAEWKREERNRKRRLRYRQKKAEKEKLSKPDQGLTADEADRRRTYNLVDELARYDIPAQVLSEARKLLWDGDFLARLVVEHYHAAMLESDHTAQRKAFEPTHQIKLVGKGGYILQTMLGMCERGIRIVGLTVVPLSAETINRPLWSDDQIETIDGTEQGVGKRREPRAPKRGRPVRIRMRKENKRERRLRQKREAELKRRERNRQARYDELLKTEGLEAAEAFRRRSEARRPRRKRRKKEK